MYIGEATESMDLEMKDKVAAITGGSVGIGLAIARGLAAEGVHVALCARDEERVMHAAQQIATDYGVRAIGVAADVSNADDISRFVQTVQHEFGGAGVG